LNIGHLSASALQGKPKKNLASGQWSVLEDTYENCQLKDHPTLANKAPFIKGFFDKGFVLDDPCMV